MLTRADVLPQLQILAEVHAMPKHWPTDLARVADRFLGILQASPPVDELQLAVAVKTYLASDASFFPKPGVLRQLALQQRRAAGATTSAAEYVRWETDWGRIDIAGQATYTACPGCGARPAVTDCGRLKVRHIARLHRERGLPTIGFSDEAEAKYADTPESGGVK